MRPLVTIYNHKGLKAARLYKHAGCYEIIDYTTYARGFVCHLSSAFRIILTLTLTRAKI